jgi:hypothetical protein
VSSRIRFLPWSLLVVAPLEGCVAPPRSFAIEEPRPAAVDASGWDGLLRAFVDRGFVDYPGLCGAPELEGFLEEVALADPGATREQRLAFWINAYNATTVGAILRGRSPRTLLGRYRFFLRERHRVAGEEITLWDLEHERLRPLGEPRIHFALVCASESCPRLASESFAAGVLDAQLEAVARDFVNDPTRNRFYPEEGVVLLSAIFDWYREDFEVDGRTLEQYVAGYVDDPGVARGLRNGAFEVRFLPYDWGLNGIPPGVEGRCRSW